MTCPDCGLDHETSGLAHLAIGAGPGQVVIEINRIGFPLTPAEARDFASVVLEAADIAEWGDELEGGDR